MPRPSNHMVPVSAATFQANWAPYKATFTLEFTRFFRPWQATTWVIRVKKWWNNMCRSLLFCTRVVIDWNPTNEMLRILRPCLLFRKRNLGCQTQLFQICSLSFLSFVFPTFQPPSPSCGLSWWLSRRSHGLTEIVELYVRNHQNVRFEYVNWPW